LTGAFRYPWKRLVYPLGARPPYRDRNGWVSAEPAGGLGAAPLEAYQDLAVIVLLGERGVGKSDILSGERQRLHGSGSDCQFVDLPDLGAAAAAGLAAALTPDEGDAPRHVLLDSLDEAVDNVPGVWQDITACLRGLEAERRSRLRLRIACRSSRWPIRFQAALEDMWPQQEGQPLRISHLGVAGLTRADVVMAAELNGLDEAFTEVLETRRLVVPLASWPVTLKPLLSAAAQGKPLPGNTVEAFAQACEQLCTETDPARRDGIASGHPSPADLLAVGRRVAAALQFGAGDALADDPDEAGLTVSMLARGTEPDGAGQQVACTEHLVRKLTEAALMAPLSARRWGFVHRSFQEYLAAQYLQIHKTPAQVRRAMLMAGDGSSRHVVDSQREVAAWLAVTDDSLFEEILACDPQVLLLADPAVRSPADRGRLTEALLALVRDDYTVQLDPLLLYRLDHPGLASQLAPVLAQDRPPNELYAALLIARACPQPALASPLLTLAEDPQVPESARSLAVEAVALGTDSETTGRLLELASRPPPDLAGAALACLWPGHLATPDMLARLPQPYPDRLAAGWDFLRTLPRLLQPADLADALAWAGKAVSGPCSHDHKALAVRILAWAVRTCGAGGADASACGPQLAEPVLQLARSEDIHEPGLPIDELSGEFMVLPGVRRAVARQVLEQAAGSEADVFAVGSRLGLFPRADAAYWAGQIPSLPPGLHDRLWVPLRNAPNDEEWAGAWELAEGSELVRTQTAHWWSLPIDHPRAADARYQREAEQQRQIRRANRRYDEAGLKARLAALTAGEVPARQGWIDVIADLYRTPEGDPVSISTRLDLRGAPSFPEPGSPLHERLLLAAAAVLWDAPLITAADTDPAATGLSDVPELWALSLLADAGSPEPGDLDAARWAGLTRALACVYAAPEDYGLCVRLVSAGVQRAGDRLEAMIPGLLERAGPDRLSVIVSRLVPALTPQLTTAVLGWARDPQRPLELREIVEDAFAEHGDQDVISDLRRTVALPGGHRDLAPGSQAAQRWLSAASTLARHDTAASWPAISATIAVTPALARPFLDRLAERSSLDTWPLDVSALQPRELAGLYDLVVTHGPAITGPPGRSGAAVYGSGQKLERFRSQIPQIIASDLTREAADQLSALAARYPGHWQLRELVRQHSRDLAARAWRPVELEDLLKLAADGTLRLARDEQQLSDVVTESLLRLQGLLSAPNGWATLLWHRLDFNASSGWWPAWEEDLSDLIATFLQHDLAARQVIVNREVQILRPGLNGHRTDIHVQANPLSAGPEPQPLTVIIECKGCWNDELTTGLSAQLVGKYLAMPGRNAGIYLVGYFDSPRWDHGRPPKRKHLFHELTDLRAEQTRIAAEEAAQKSVSVTAFILDCRLPSGGAAA
jgi:hypothetical protein